MIPTAPVSVVVPTLGRPSLLRACIESLAACDPAPDEIVVVAQGEWEAVEMVVGSLTDLSARVVRCEGRGRGLALNVGLREAASEMVLITDDDCRVRPEWVGAGACADAETIVTGRVVPVGDRALVTASIEADGPRVYSGRNGWGMLYGGNMACQRRSLLALGGFDERMRPSAEDDELSYRWVRSGRRIRYEPSMVVLHEAWRTEAQVTEVYAGYAHGQGMFFGKHLRRGDLRLLRNVGGELAAGVRGELSHRVGHSSGPDPRRATLRALPGGIAAGWRSGGPPSSSRLRDGLRRVRPLRSAWLLARAGAQAVRDGPAANRTRVEAEFESPDPWHYATDPREQECLRHQAEVLDRVRAGDQFGATLEVGCAEGVFTETLASRCASVLAVDLSPTAVERARRRADWPDAVTFDTWDLRADPMPDEFDLIVVAGVLEYLHSPAGLRRAVEKLVGGLTPGGRLFVVSTRVPAAESAWWARWFPRGARINRLVAADHLLRAVVEERADWYVISVFERTGERRSQRRDAAG